MSKLDELLGHTSINTTEGYCEYLTADEERVAKQAGTKYGTENLKTA
jgi:hypothetical protein